MYRGHGKWLRLLALVLCLCFLAGCTHVSEIASNVAAAGEYPIDIGGTIISSKPQRAVVLSDSLADVIAALGCETQLAAAADSCTQENLRDLQKIDPTDLQAIIGLNADLVLADSFSDEMLDGLSEAGITAFAVRPATDRSDFERLYSQVGAAFLGATTGYDKGISVAQGIFTTLDDINRIVPTDKIITVCYLYDLDGSAVTGDALASTIMSYAGVTNVFSSLAEGRYEFESLRVSNPNFIFCAPGLKSQLFADSRFSGFQAIRNNHVYEMDEALLRRQGRTVISAAYEISAACFPELTEESSMTVSDPIDDIDASVSSAMATPEPEEDTTDYETLQVGDMNEDVLQMQTRLEELGYLDVDYDGMFGDYTASCVKEFQKANGLEETGIADAETLRKLYSSTAKPKSE